MQGMSNGKLYLMLSDALVREAFFTLCRQFLSCEVICIFSLDNNMLSDDDLVLSDVGYADGVSSAVSPAAFSVAADRWVWWHEPIALAILLSRIQVLLSPIPPMVALSGQVRIDLRKRVLQTGDAMVALTDKEIAILQELIRANGAMITQEVLLKAVWNYDSLLDTHTLQTHIYRLRNKLREAGLADDMIIAVDGGYQLQLGHDDGSM